VADDGGAQSESVRQRGLPVTGGGGPGAGSGGEAWALERRGQRGVETGGRVEQRERGTSDSAAVWQRGKIREMGGVPSVGVPHDAGMPWGLAPSSGRRPAAARARRSWATCAARTRAGWTERGREASDGWAMAQCRAAVPLIGGAGLSAGAVESAGARGSAREESGVAEPR
jgi:hypothetical protein